MKASMKKALSAAHTPEARAKATATRRKNFLAKQRAKEKMVAANEEIIPLHAIPPKQEPRRVTGTLMRSNRSSQRSPELEPDRTRLAMAVVTLVAHIIGPS